MNEIEFDRFKQTEEYQEWLNALDGSVRGRLEKRMDKYEEDKKLPTTAGFLQADGIGEIRFDFGPGYRIYFCQYGKVIILLLTGGDKDTQASDIERAKAIKPYAIKKLETERESKK